MRLQLYKSLWGVVRHDGGSKSLAQALASLRAQGYVGVECSVRLAYDLHTHETEEGGGAGFAGSLAEHGLAWIPILFSSGPVDGWHPHLPGDERVAHDGDVASHVRALRDQAAGARGLAAQTGYGLPPVALPFFNVHGGHDSWSFAKSVQLLRHVREQVEGAVGVPCVHEIHRGRLTYSPWRMAELAGAVDELKLVGDFAHWTAVTETEPGACAVLDAAISTVAPHVHHLHARVGHANASQVADPRAEMWLPHTEAFERWWDVVWRVQRAADMQVSTLTPEHGPPPYQPCGVDGTPLADIEAVNVWLGERQRRRFDQQHARLSSGG